MIIRRRHNSRFSVIPNAIWDDERLPPDTTAVLGYLLSRPHDWQVRLAQVAKRYGIGRQKIQRIMRELIDAGYVTREQPHIDGVFGSIEYVVRDEPIEIAENAPHPTSSHESNSVASSSQSSFQPADEQRVENQRADYQRAENQPADNNKERIYTKTNLTKDAGARDVSVATKLDDLIAVWPPDQVLSKRAAEQAWQQVAEPDRQRLVDCAGPYLAECRRINRKVCDLKTYIAERRDERIASRSPSAPSIMVEAQTPEWSAWRQHRLSRGESVAFMDSQAAKGVGWSVKSPWPPSPAPIDRAATTTSEGAAP